MKRLANLGIGLRRLREMRGLTQAQVEEHLGLGARTLSGYEAGRYNPSVRRLDELLDLYRASAEDLGRAMAGKPPAQEGEGDRGPFLGWCMPVGFEGDPLAEIEAQVERMLREREERLAAEEG